MPIEIAAVFFGEVLWIYEFGKSGFDFVFTEDEDLGYGDWVEPPLDPAPDGREEGRGTDDL